MKAWMKIGDKIYDLNIHKFNIYDAYGVLFYSLYLKTYSGIIPDPF